MGKKSVRLLQEILERLSNIEQQLAENRLADRALSEAAAKGETPAKWNDVKLTLYREVSPVQPPAGPSDMPQEFAGCQGGCVFPSHYYSPDGRIACMKCGRVVQTMIPTFTLK